MAKKRPDSAKVGARAAKGVTRPLVVSLSDDAVRAITSAGVRAASQTPGSAAQMSAAATQAAEKTARAYTSGLAQSQDRLFRQAGTASNLGAGGVASRMTRVGGMASGLHDLGFTNAAAMLSKMALPLAVATQAAGHALDTAKTLALTAHDNYSTDAQLGRRLVRELVPGGAKAQGYLDAFTGRAAGMEQAHIDEQKRAAAVQSRLGTSAFEAGFNPQQAGRSAASLAYNLPGAMVAPPVLDRSNAAGEQQYRDAMRLLPLKQQSVKLDRESRVATAERVGSERELGRITARRVQLQREEGRLESQVQEASKGWWTGSGASFEQLLMQQKTKNDEVRAMVAQERSATEAAAAARGREASARGEAERAKVREDLIGRAENLQERADLAKSGAARLGSMSPVERQQAAAIARMGKQFGVDALPAEWRSMFAQVAPQEFQAAAVRAGASSPAYRSLQEAGFVDFPGRPGQAPASIQREADVLRERAAREEFRIDAQTSADIAASFRGLGRDIARLMEENRQVTVNEILRQIRQGRNQ